MKISKDSADVHGNEDLIGRQVHINKEHMETGNSKYNRTGLNADLNTTEFNLFLYSWDFPQQPTQINIQNLGHSLH